MEFLSSHFIIGGIAGGTGVVLYNLLAPRKICPKCGSPLPRFRKPSSFKEAMLGGWHCQTCNTHLNRSGNSVSDG